MVRGERVNAVSERSHREAVVQLHTPSCVIFIRNYLKMM